MFTSEFMNCNAFGVENGNEEALFDAETQRFAGAQRHAFHFGEVGSSVDASWQVAEKGLATDERKY
jgi:hypothetical protein